MRWLQQLKLFSLLGLVLLLAMPSAAFANMGMYGDPEMAMMLQKHARTSGAIAQEDKLKRIQAHFLQEMFLKHLMNNEISLLQDEDEDNPYTSKADMEISKQLMVQAYADLLAEEDILQLEKTYLKK